MKITMKTKLTILFLAIASIASATRLEDIAFGLSKETEARKVWIRPAPKLNEPVSATIPTNIYSSIAPADLARVPAVLKINGAATGMLKWTAPAATQANPVIGYQLVVDSSWPVKTIYYATTTEFPFNCEYANVAAGEFWKVRSVFKDGSVSAWNISLIFPQQIGW